MTVKILAWDTTTEYASVVALVDGELLSELNYKSGLKHSSVLIPMINFLLESTSLDLKDFDAFSAAIGPGSFTGIRVGLATAKAFCYALKKPFIPVVSLDALAKKEEDRTEKIIAMIDAKKEEVFAAIYEKGKRILDPVNIKPDRLLERIYGTESLFIGTGAIRYRELIEKTLGSKAIFSERSLFAAAEIARLAEENFKKGKILQPGEIKALYIRASDAELQKWGK